MLLRDEDVKFCFGARSCNFHLWFIYHLQANGYSYCLWVSTIIWNTIARLACD